MQAYIAGVFGFLLCFGGSMGYAKKKSKMSLIAGGVSGVVYLFVAYQLGFNAAAKPSDKALATNVGVGLSALLAGMMGFRAVKSDFATIPLAVAVSAAATGAALYLL
jgi:uncharacterized membrane protein (UPF0136 family)